MPALRTLLALLLFPSLAVADQLRTLDGKTIEGSVVSLDDKEIVFQATDGGTTKHPLDSVLGLDLRPVAGLGGKSYAEVRLVDDTVLRCKEANLKGKDLSVVLHSGQEFKVPLTSVITILKGAEDAKVRKTFDSLVNAGAKRDRVVIVSGDAVNDLEGTLGNADDKGEKIAFKTTDGDDLQVPLSKLRGIIFYRESPANLQPICMVYDVDGNAIVANKVSAKGDQLTVSTTIPNVSLTLSQANIARFDYNMGKLTFLSDLTPSKIIEDSAVGLIVTHRKDVNLDGEPLQLGTQTYKKGLSLHAHTELEYDLKGRYRKFTAVVGVDPREGGDSKATVTIEVDGRTKFTQVVTVDKTENLDIDVSKAKTIRIIVTSSNFLDLHDHVTIANPKVTQ
jgi:hypothetical protein